MIASQSVHTEIVKILVAKEGININAKDKVYLNDLIFQNEIWNFFKLCMTVIFWATAKGSTEIMKILVRQEGIDIISKDKVYFII